MTTVVASDSVESFALLSWVRGGGKQGHESSLRTGQEDRRGRGDGRARGGSEGTRVLN